MRRTVIIAILVVIAALAAKEFVTPGTLGFSLFQSKLVVDGTLVVVCLLLYLLGGRGLPSRAQTGGKVPVDPESEFVDAELIRREDAKAPEFADVEILRTERETKRSDGPPRLDD